MDTYPVWYLHLYDSPYLRAQSSKDLLREPALHPCSCLHDSPQLTNQVPIRLVNNPQCRAFWSG
jgi:hypothetical protein